MSTVVPVSNSAVTVAGPHGATPQPRAGGTLRLGFPADIPNLDPHYPIGISGNTINNLFDRLGWIDQARNFQPKLAERLEQSTDLKQTKLTLRRGVQFHNGRELTAADIKWNIDRVRDPKVGGGILSNYAEPLVAVQAPDRYTVLLTTAHPWPAALEFLASLLIVEPASMQQQAQVYTKPVGTGPFQFVEYRYGDYFRFQKNPNYWEAGKPYLDEIYVKIFSDPVAMIVSLEAGAIDATAIVPAPQEIARLGADPRFRAIMAQPPQDTYMLAFNVSAEPGSNKLLRRALNWAIDRERIASLLLPGVTQPRNLPWATTSPAYDSAKDRTYTFDLDRARSLVAASGVADPELDFNYSTAMREWQDIGQVIQGDLAKIGVKLNLLPTELPALLALQTGVRYRGLTQTIQLRGALHPSVLYSNPWFNPTANWIGLNDPAFDQWAAAMQFETDPARARQLYNRWNDHVLDQSMTICIATYNRGVLTSSKVHGFEHTMMESLEYVNAWLE